VQETKINNPFPGASAWLIFAGDPISNNHHKKKKKSISKVSEVLSSSVWSRTPRSDTVLPSTVARARHLSPTEEAEAEIP